MNGRAIGLTLATDGGIVRFPRPVDPSEESLRRKEKSLREAFRTAYIRTQDTSNEVWHAYCALTTFYEGRLKKLENQLRAALASDALDDDTREHIVRAVTGSRNRDANLLTQHEAEVIAWYRATDNDGRQMLRTLLRMVPKGGQP